MTKKYELLAYYPLWGASFDSDDLGMVGPLVAASYPFRDEWFDLMSTTTRNHAVMNEGAWFFDKEDQVPFCLTSWSLKKYPLTGKQAKQLDSEEDAIDARVRLAITALRLHKPGWFLSPDSSQISVRHGGFITTKPGLYRDMLPRLVKDAPEACYQLSIDELQPITETRTTPSRLFRITEALGSLEQGSQFPETWLAVAAFNFSYGYGLSVRQRCILLFTALETMLGPMSGWRSDDSVGRIPFRRRVEWALRLAAKNDAEESAEWIDSRTGGRRIRNATAHGSSLGGDQDLDVSRLREVVRATLLAMVGSAASVKEIGDDEVASFTKLIISIDRGQVLHMAERDGIAEMTGSSTWETF